MPKIRIANYLIIILKVFDTIGCLSVAFMFLINSVGTFYQFYFGNAQDKLIINILFITGLLYLVECILLFMPSNVMLQRINTLVFFVTVIFTILIWLPQWPHPMSLVIAGLLSSLLFVLIKNRILIAK